MTEHILDSITSGVKTNEEMDADPYGFRVHWIGWDSGFRRSGLRIGDRVIALDGVRWAREDRKSFHHKAFGSYSESQHWREIGAKDGRRTTVTVVRGRELLDITGEVRAERVWKNDAGRTTLGPGGPDRLANDGFGHSWSSWMEKRADFGGRVLDGGWWRGTVPNNRTMLAEHLAEKPRVDLLVKNYPGPFATAMLEDWEAVHRALLGTRYDLRPEDLAYRERGEERAAEIAAAGKAAREAMLAALAGETIPAFPAVDAIHGDRSKVTGKVVVLPPILHRHWVMQAGRAWLAAGSARDGWYFADTTSPAIRRAFDASYRYQKAVSPKVPESLGLIGRIGPNPKMLVVGDDAVTGLSVEAIGVSFGDALFVDVSREEGGESRFAGEDLIGRTQSSALSPDAPPEAVLDAFFRALEAADEEAWRTFFVTWDATIWNGEPWYRPIAGPSSATLSSEWVRARRVLERSVYGVRVVRVDAPRVLLRGDEFEGAPKVEEVLIETDQIGLFDGEYRAFKDLNVNRLWKLQRRDGGPWRVVTEKGD